ncbi:phytanoyl-CoA dioxygenase [Pseudonocardia sp. ICBG1293]|uniref:phytanoyl-CoA dioxygenase n=1 Tax=Pseudonocardia sp. ICBG1293 TaxID=2844382 RepID=UPI001CCCC324|nr:phytanoyl-CoA dioxygenase [Pseudonocardia sp. ICBG1293]
MIEQFVRDGWVHLPGAVPADLAARCRALLRAALLRDRGVDLDDPTGWDRPVLRVGGMADPEFTASAGTPALRSAFDALVGAGRWRPRTGMGTFPIRFPVPGEPGDDGWHVESSFAGPDGGPRLAVDSRGRALLMLFLYTDVGPRDAPTLLRTGSHHAVARLLAPYGSAGAEWSAFCAEAVPATAGCPEAAAVGRAGDVYLVHPFVVHRAQVMSPSAAGPRVIAQPPLEPATEPAFDLVTGTAPVERVVREALR